MRRAAIGHNDKVHGHTYFRGTVQYAHYKLIRAD